ncbi:MAG: UDP-2,3-diacylglucosamine diphosphatase [Gammaproteobacteria bacterium]|nr:UDP-2,3-diacylglucosamine diphosphatase [Gammaproteobacteria bacterium]
MPLLAMPVCGRRRVTVTIEAPSPSSYRRQRITVAGASPSPANHRHHRSTVTVAVTVMSTAFISDIHLNPQRPDSFARFERFMAQAVRRLRQLYILGDLFDYWVGDDGVDAIGQGRAEAALRAVTDAGVTVFFMRGNRDFLIGDEFAARTNCRLLPDPSTVTVDERTFLLSHGDALCTDDTEHQAARREMLSAKWQFAFMQKPLPERIDAAAELRRRSESRKQRTSRAMMDVNQSAVESFMREHRADTLIHGHTHRPAVHQFNLDGKPAWRYVLGDWHQRRSALYYQRGILALKK